MMIDVLRDAVEVSSQAAILVLKPSVDHFAEKLLERGLRHCIHSQARLRTISQQFKMLPDAVVIAALIAVDAAFHAVLGA